MAKRSATRAEKLWMARVAELGCILSHLGYGHECQGRTEVHHKTNGGVRASHYHTMPLYFNHHSAQTGLPFGYAVHKGTKSFEERYKAQDELIQLTYQMLGEEYE